MGDVFTLDGVEIPFLPGDTFALALWRAGERVLSESHGLGRPQGLYCGIGRCGACNATVDGELNRPLCLHLARPAAVQRVRAGARPQATGLPVPHAKSESLASPVVIVGAGDTGRRLLDRMRSLGVKALAVEERPRRAVGGDDLLHAQVVALWPEASGRFLVWATSPARSIRIEADTVVLATGSVSVPPPVDGGRLPGVLTVDALTMFREAGVHPGEAGIVVTRSQYDDGWPSDATCVRQASQAGMRIAKEHDALVLEIGGARYTANWVAIEGVDVPSLELWRAWRGTERTPGSHPALGWWEDDGMFVAGAAAGVNGNLGEEALDALCSTLLTRVTRSDR